MDYVIQILGPLLQGTAVTLQVFLLTLVLAVPLGLALALVRVSHFRVASGLVSGYVWLGLGGLLLPFAPPAGMIYDAALHAVRWSTGAHIKNAFSPYLARHWLRQHPEAPGFFRTAASMADASPSPQMELGL